MYISESFEVYMHTYGRRSRSGTHRRDSHVQGVKAHPRDYLNVFCLGNREPVEPNAPPPPKSAKPKSRQVISC